MIDLMARGHRIWSQMPTLADVFNYGIVPSGAAAAAAYTRRGRPSAPNFSYKGPRSFPTRGKKIYRRKRYRRY